MPRKPPPLELNEHEKLTSNFVRCFESAEGQAVLAYFKATFQDATSVIGMRDSRGIDPYRTLVCEGARYVYLHIKELIEEGLNARAGNKPKPIDPNDISPFDL